ncbi:Hpt domain-containing protein [Dyadobacter sp. 32]|uniref:Hpt domain-containing protein n=1 Tax=Dyadobacter sp. 32 TaxID=538966 RepID=UPI0011EC93A1
MPSKINPALDLEYIDRVYGNDANIISLIFNAFLSDCLPRWYILENLIEAQNQKEAASLVHGLKPSFTMTGLGSIKKMIEELEQLILNNAGRDEQAALYFEINKKMEVLVPIIKEEAARLEQMS